MGNVPTKIETVEQYKRFIKVIDLLKREISERNAGSSAITNLDSIKTAMGEYWREEQAHEKQVKMLDIQQEQLSKQYRELLERHEIEEKRIKNLENSVRKGQEVQKELQKKFSRVASKP